MEKVRSGEKQEAGGRGEEGEGGGGGGGEAP